MNVRPADLSSLAAATDLFAATSASSVMGPIPFERLLRADSTINGAAAIRPADTIATSQPTENDAALADQLPSADDDDVPPSASPDNAKVNADSNDEQDMGIESRQPEPIAAETEANPAAESVAAAAAVQAVQPIMTPEAKQSEEPLVTSEVIDTAPKANVIEVKPATQPIRSEVAVNGPAAQVASAPAHESTATDAVSTPVNVDPSSETHETGVANSHSTASTSEEAQGIGVPPSALVAQAVPQQTSKDTPVAGQRRAVTSRTRDLAPQRVDDEEPTADPMAMHATRHSELKEPRDFPDRLSAQLPVTKANDGSSNFPAMQPVIHTASIESSQDLAVPRAPQADVSASPPSEPTASAAPSATIANSALVSRLPGHALVRGQASQSSEPAGVHVDTARFLQRVAKAFQSARDHGGEISLRLSPPELGALRVEVMMQDQGLVAKVQAETPEARTILLENLPALRDRLAEQGIKLDRFDVDLSHQRSNQDQGRQSGQSDSHPQPLQPRVPRTATPAVVVDAGAKLPPSASIIHDRRLNVVV